jgi:hypothetical protein
MPEQSETSRYETLVSRLIEWTKRTDLCWESTTGQDTFITVMNRGSVEVVRLQDYDQDGDPVEWYELVILDRDGRVAERLSSQPGLTGRDAKPFSLPLLSELFKLARSRALDTERLVDDLIGELS